MDTVEPLRFIFASLFVLALIGAMALLLKRYGHQLQSGWQPLMKTVAGKESPMPPRLAIIEVRYLDPKRKLVLVRRDDVEHLLLLAHDRELVIESTRKHDERDADEG